MASVSIEDAIKAKKEAEAAAKDPANKPEAKQIASTAATNGTQQLIDAAEAVQIGAPTAAKIDDPARDLRMPNAGALVASPASVVAVNVPEVTDAQVRETAMRTFRHVYAGATAIMPSGKTIRFGGGVGGPGFYASSKEEEIKFLEELSETHGSQVSEPGRVDYVQEFQTEVTDAAGVARENTARYQDPKALAAFENMGNTIKHNG